MHNFRFYIAVMLLSTQIFADHKNTPKVYFICNLVSIVTWNIQNGLLLAVVTFVSFPSSARLPHHGLCLYVSAYVPKRDNKSVCNPSRITQGMKIIPAAQI